MATDRKEKKQKQRKKNLMTFHQWVGNSQSEIPSKTLLEIKQKQPALLVISTVDSLKLLDSCD